MSGATWTQNDIDSLKAAIVSGVLEVEYDGPPRRREVYQSTQAMLNVLAIASQGVSATTGKKNFRLVTYRKGFYDDCE